MKNLEFFESVVNSLNNKRQVKYYANGQKFKLEYRNKRYFFSNLKKNCQKTVEKKFRDAIIATLSCIMIPTLNPSSIIVTFILDDELKTIQIISVTSKRKVLKTEKILKKYISDFPIVNYGDVTLFTDLARFNYDSYSKIDFNEFREKDTISTVLCDVIFNNCEYILSDKFLKSNLAEIDGQYKVGSLDGRVYRIY